MFIACRDRNRSIPAVSHTIFAAVSGPQPRSAGNEGAKRVISGSSSRSSSMIWTVSSRQRLVSVRAMRATSPCICSRRSRHGGEVLGPPEATQRRLPHRFEEPVATAAG
jgi:hypothetical protein